MPKYTNVKFGSTSKLNGIRCFNLDPSSCVDATEECRKYCYARNGRLNWKQNREIYESNKCHSVAPNFVNLILDELSPNERFFRIHATGDFYSIPYFQAWVKIATLSPDILFLAYTRSTAVFDFHRPSNLKLILSVDDSTPSVPDGIRVAKVVDADFLDFYHLETIEGLDTKRQYRVCLSNDCLRCLHCWKSDDNIIFPKK